MECQRWKHYVHCVCRTSSYVLEDLSWFRVTFFSRAFEKNLNEMSQIYSTTTVNDLLLDPDLNHIMETSRDADVLLGAWWGWRTAVGPKLKNKYVENIRLLNQAAVENGKSRKSTCRLTNEWHYTSSHQFWIRHNITYLWLGRLTVRVLYIIKHS